MPINADANLFNVDIIVLLAVVIPKSIVPKCDFARLRIILSNRFFVTIYCDDFRLAA